VLSMYSDPAVREQEIKNMSEVYSTLKSSVLPELRRARFIANVEYTNWTSEELTKLVDENIDVLDEPALLHAATLVSKSDDKLSIYKKAIDKYNSATAKFNSAVVNIKDGKLAKAGKFLEGLTEDADVLNAKGVIALQEGKLADAAKLFAKAGNDESKENAAVVDILNGDYKAAAEKLAGTKGNNAALAQLLNKNYAAAATAACDCPAGAYLKAVAAARQGKAADVKALLEVAKQDPELAKRIANDVEFAQYK
ncbi:MAG: hypothetical protein HUJ94_00075, partial [Bacteroidales bacterium]|nr:hypothetical protein [Bacteroidales bacterium]